MTLLQHLQNINAKSKAEMAKTPGLWIGMITEDLDHWAGYGVHTPEQLDRYFLEVDVYEMHKEAYGVKGRHYNFKEMSNEDLKKELDHLAEVAKREQEIEKRMEEASYQTFLKRIVEAQNLGAETKEDAIKWILQAEGLENEKDAGYICYQLGLNYDKEYLFATKQ